MQSCEVSCSFTKQEISDLSKRICLSENRIRTQKSGMGTGTFHCSAVFISRAEIVIKSNATKELVTFDITFINHVIVNRKYN